MLWRIFDKIISILEHYLNWMLASDTQSLQRTAVLFAHLVAPCKGLQSRCFNEKHKETSSMQQQRLSEINTWCTSDFQSFQELKALVETIHFIVSMRASSFLLQFEFWRLVKHVLIYSKVFCMVYGITEILPFHSLKTLWKCSCKLRKVCTNDIGV